MTLALQIAASVVVARWLTPYETGIYALALASIGVLSLIQSLGLRMMMVREEELTPEIKSTAFSVNAAIAIALSLMIVAASFGGGQALHEPGVRRVMLVIAVTPLFGIFSFLPCAMLERDGDFRSLAIIGTLTSFISTVATIVLAISGFSYMSAAWAQWAGAITGVIATFWFASHHASYRIGLTAWRRIAGFGIQMVAVTGAAQAVQRISEICLGKIIGLGSLGLFNRANSINSIVWNNVHVVIGQVMFVDFARIHRSGESLRDRYIQLVTIVTAVLWPAFAGLAIVGRPFIFYVYGAKWLGCYRALICITIASMGLVASSMTWEIFSATGNLRTQTRIEYIRSVISLAAFFACCFISLEAAAASRVFDALVAFVLYRPHLNRMTQTTLVDFAPVYARSLLLTAVAVAPAFVVMAANGFVANVPLLQLGGAILLGAALWLFMLILTGNPLADEIKKIATERKILSSQ